MTTSFNNIVRGGAQGRSIFASLLPLLTSSVSFNQGDMLCIDTSAHTVVPAATGKGANMLGVAINKIVNGLPASPYPGVPVNEASSDLGGPLYSVVASMTLTTGDALFPGTLVYIGADAQTVAVTQPGSDPTVGLYVGPAISSAAAGQKGDILIGARYGMSGLTF